MRWLPLMLALGASGCATHRAVEAPGRTPAPAESARPVAVVPRGPNEAWRTKLDADSVLVGEIWDVKQGIFITLGQLGEALSKVRFVLVGEKHDNPDHHVLQGEVIARLASYGRRPAVVLEMLGTEQQAAIDAYLSRSDATAAGFGAAVAWEKTSWPPFAEYRPIVLAAWSAKLRLVAGNLAQADAKALVKRGITALPEEQAKSLRLDQPFPEELESSLLEELRRSHCGHLPEKLLAPMALAQHARDATMAKALTTSGATDGAVLIAGGGHVRRDRGVPFYLALEAPGASVASVLLREVRHGDTDPKRYAADDGPFDYVWFTPRASDEDPCAAFGK
jgi:uncharacterized iron-regulated protein